MNNVIYTKVKFFRNLKDYKFSNKLTPEQKEEIVNKISSLLKDFKLLNVVSLDVETIKQLKKQDLLSKTSTNILYNKKTGVVVDLFNIEHLTIIASDVNVKSAYNNAKKVADLLKDSVNLSYNDDYGYLMSDISNVGAGISLEADIYLNAISTINKIDQVKQNVNKLGYSFKAKNNGLFKISTKCNLGFSETEIVEDFANTLSKLQDLEIESLKMLDLSNHDELLDKAQRSLAILNSAHLMNFEELIKLITNVRVGVNIGCLNIESSKLEKLQEIITNVDVEFISKSESLLLAEQVKNILKGE